MLLDTQVWIWWNANDRRLGPRARLAIRGASEVFFSAASAWEIAIKTGLGKLKLPKGIQLEAELAADSFLPLPIDLGHALGVAALPRIHSDPFDRLLVSQALAEELTIVTADPAVARYSVPVLAANE